MRVRFGLYRGLTLAIDPKCELSYLVGTFERETQPFLKTAITTAKSLIDIGAGNGELVVWALSHPNVKRVVAYEPDANRWPIFQENLRLNNREKDSRLIALRREFYDTEVLADNDLLESLPQPILLKLDIDGGEEIVLKKMTQKLRSDSFRILVETHSIQLDRSCSELLSDAGYTVQSIAQAPWRWLLKETRMDFNQWLVATR